MFKKSKIYRKAGPFMDNRFFPVLILWGCVLAVYNCATWGIEYLSDGAQSVHLTLVSLASFGDGRVVMLLSLATLAVMGLTSLLFLNVNRRSLNLKNIDLIVYRMWDEVSSASMHASAALFVSVYGRAGEDVHYSLSMGPTRMLPAVALAVMAFLFYHWEGDAEPEASNATGVPLAEKA